MDHPTDSVSRRRAVSAPRPALRGDGPRRIAPESLERPLDAGAGGGGRARPMFAAVDALRVLAESVVRAETNRGSRLMLSLSALAPACQKSSLVP